MTKRAIRPKLRLAHLRSIRITRKRILILRAQRDAKQAHDA
jgi:hypothetical protein